MVPRPRGCEASRHAHVGAPDNRLDTRRRAGQHVPVTAPNPGTDLAFRHRLAWAAPAGVLVAAVVASMGALFGERPGLSSALALAAAIVLVALLLRWLTRGVLVRLSTAAAEGHTLRLELDAARRTNEAFRNLAHHDHLTGLPNRGLLHDRLSHAIARARRQANHLALLFLDLDAFKAVNDSFGHGFGDRVLVDLARRLRDSVRAGDTVARLGGDEFVVLLDPVSGREDAGRVAAKVRGAVRAPIHVDGHEVAMTASIGMSLFPHDGVSPDALMKSADAAMYRAKLTDTGRDAAAEGVVSARGSFAGPVSSR